MKIIKDIRSLTLCGGFGAISFVIMWSLGSIILMTTGLPLVGGIASSIANSFVLVIGILLIDKIGALTIISTTLTTLSIPTIIFGPPGIYKFFLGIFMGVLCESVIVLFRYKRWSYILGLAITFAASVPAEYFIFKMLGFPAAEKLQSMLIPIMAIYFINAAVGSWLGMKFYEKKLSKLQVVQMWKSKSDGANS